MFARKTMMKSARRWLVVPASVAFVMLASTGESPAASDKAYRWIGDPRLATDISAARRVQRRVNAPASVTVPFIAPPVRPMDSYASAPTSYGYGIGDNSRNQTW
ncbi:hypothetical protein SAMN03159423_1520 [Bradyrhizobium sp. NFR13]|jgi:hypothetical protein|uniref:hypothetical protein n=1 Tax=Bradyrhizobium sp. NFR13 TaxID=1566285 RepID=UPI0008F23272|nr:hypothetical protein [Bradyrhizobium sp. NFR13]SFL36696.1 hypothetical protein SAMN03159423_1520 [Bradyrhizobium sp. NFR13]